MEPEKIREELDRLRSAADAEPQNAALIDRIGKLFLTLGEWEKAVEILSSAAASGYQPLLNDLSIARYMLNRHKSRTRGYHQDQRHAEAASSLQLADTLLTLAETWKGIDEDKAKELCCAAFEIDPRDPLVLRNFLEREIAYRRDSSVLEIMSQEIEAAIERCREHIDAGTDLPRACYTIGTFYLLLKRPYLSLAAYAKAIDLSSADQMTDSPLQDLKRLAAIREELPGYEWVERLLLLACASAGGERGDKALQQIKRLTAPHKNVLGPVVIVAGGCDEFTDTKQGGYRKLLIEAFKDYRGTIISGGTTAGMSGLVGDVHDRYEADITAIGYVPRILSVKATIDRRYNEIRETDGSGFSPLEVVHYWSDLIASGIAPVDVKLLGIEGGQVAAAEYRIALALGATVGIVEGSGFEAAKLLSDRDWRASPNLLPLPTDALTIRAFVGYGVPRLEPDLREAVAQAIHEEYRETQRRTKLTSDPSMADWRDLADNLKESNRKQADDIVIKLREIGCTMHKARSGNARMMRLTDLEVERLGEMEHARWMVERLCDGWYWGPQKDVEHKATPYLVPWRELPEDVKELDRNAVRAIPQHLARNGIEVRRP